jgi:hypothetical protein
LKIYDAKCGGGERIWWWRPQQIWRVRSGAAAYSPSTAVKASSVVSPSLPLSRWRWRDVVHLSVYVWHSVVVAAATRYGGGSDAAWWWRRRDVVAAAARRGGGSDAAWWCGGGGGASGGGSSRRWWWG